MNINSLEKSGKQYPAFVTIFFVFSSDPDNEVVFVTVHFSHKFALYIRRP